MSATANLEDLKEINRPTKVETLGEAFKLFWSFHSPFIIMLAIAGSWTTRLWLASWSWWDLLVAAAVLLFWPMQEWLIHVFILHFKPKRMGDWEFDMHASKMHRIHHQVPWVLEYVFVPLQTELLTLFLGIPAVIGLAYAIGIPMSVTFTGIAVFTAFGLVYEWVHFLVHTNYRPKSAFYRRIWENHRWHHFKNENYWFGVTRLEADAILRTSPDPKEVEKSPTCRTLGITTNGSK